VLIYNFGENLRILNTCFTQLNFFDIDIHQAKHGFKFLNTQLKASFLIWNLLYFKNLNCPTRKALLNETGLSNPEIKETIRRRKLMRKQEKKL
jgi:hypothetical protein